MDGTPVTFRSALVPPYVRRPKTFEAALPWLNLEGISSGEMGAALKVHLGSEAKSLSANTVSRFKGEWAKEYDGLETQIWLMNQSSISGLTVFTTAFGERIRSSAYLSLLASRPVVRSACWRSKTGCASLSKAGERFCSD